MTQPPGTLRPIPDPQAEMERLAEERKHGPVRVLDVADVYVGRYIAVSGLGPEPLPAVVTAVKAVTTDVDGSVTIEAALITKMGQ